MGIDVLRIMHLVGAVVWPAGAALGLMRARRLHRRRARVRIYLLMALGLVVGANSLVMALAEVHPPGPVHPVVVGALSLLGAVLLYLVASYGDELAAEERVLFALSRRSPGELSGRRRPLPLLPGRAARSPRPSCTACSSGLATTWNSATVERTVDYYLARTAHGSTLSRVVHAWALARSDGTRSWAVFRDALAADLDDTKGGTTGEGVHLGAMAGTIDLLLRGYGGLAIHDDTLRLTPHLPDGLDRIRFDVHCRAHCITIDVARDELHLHVHPCAARPVRIAVGDEIRELAGGDHWTQSLRNAG